MALKDLVTGLFDKDVRNQRSFDKLVSRLVSRNHQSEERMAAIETLAQLNTDEALRMLFRRWDMQADKKREDVAEKQYLSEILAEKGPRVLPFIREHNDRSTNITWPIQVMQRISSEEEVATELIRLLKVELGRVASFKPVKKVRALQLLSDFDHPDMAEVMVLALNDFDANVRFEALQILRRIGGEQARGAVIDRLNHPEEDSGRIRESILDVLVEQGWRVTDRKDDLVEHLGERFRIGPKDSLVRA